MLATIKIIEILESDLVGKPTPHTLAMGKNVIAFNLKITPKLLDLKTGKSFSFEREIYEVMNIIKVQSKNDYLKLNCVRKKSLEVI